MRLLLINYEFPPLGGGAGNATKHIAKELARMGHNVLVLSTWFRELPEQETIDGYKIIRIHSRRKRIDRSNPIEMLHFIWCAIREGPTLIKSFSPEAMFSFFAIPSGVVAWYFKRKFGIPYIVSLRGGDVPGFLPKNLKWWHIFSSPLTALVWKHANVVVANSIGLKELAEKTARKFGKDVAYIPNGVDMELFSPSRDKTKNGFKILFVGRLIEQKGVWYLLEGLAHIRDHNATLFKRISCDIVGDGPLRGELEQLSHTLSLENVVKFPGWISRDNLPVLYRSASVFVLPSFDEGMPNVILEAMASGLPIIATDIKGNNELIRNGVNGFLYKHHEELPGALIKLIENPVSSERMGEESRKKSIDYIWSHVARSYDALLKQ